MHAVNHWCCPIWIGLQISGTTPSDFEWCQRQRVWELRSDLVELNVRQIGGLINNMHWSVKKKTQSYALFSWSIHQAPLGNDWRLDSSSKLSHYLYTLLSICSCFVCEMLLGSWICRLSMATISLPVQNTSGPLWSDPFLVFHPCTTAWHDLMLNLVTHDRRNSFHPYWTHFLDHIQSKEFLGRFPLFIALKVDISRFFDDLIRLNIVTLFPFLQPPFQSWEVTTFNSQFTSNLLGLPPTRLVRLLDILSHELLWTISIR